MNRVMVIGCCGAGKSTFSRSLHQATGLPLIHLDRYYWQSEWKQSPTEEWKQTVTKLVERPRWIMDGNYGSTMDQRIARADSIIFLDYSTLTCLWRVTKRTILHYGRARPDMPPGCRERFDLPFLHYVATFNRTRRKTLVSKLDRVSYEKEVCIVRDDDEAALLLRELA